MIKVTKREFVGDNKVALNGVEWMISDEIANQILAILNGEAVQQKATAKKSSSSKKTSSSNKDCCPKDSKEITNLNVVKVGNEYRVSWTGHLDKCDLVALSYKFQKPYSKASEKGKKDFGFACKSKAEATRLAKPTTLSLQERVDGYKLDGQWFGKEKK